MDRLHAMQTFVKVVEMNSFSRAADALGMPRASATITIKNLEAHLKVNLMQRTTRRLNLTPEGAQYYERCVRILSDIKETEDALASTGRGPQGPLRVDMPGSIGRLIIAPRIMEFKERYPDINLSMRFVDGPLNPAQSAVDCVICSGYRHEPGYVRRSLGEASMLTAASPVYLERNGMPTELDELQRHYAVHYHSSVTDRTVTHTFVIDAAPREVKMQSSLTLSDLEAYVACGLAGAGIIQAPSFLLRRHLAEGRLVEIFPQWKPLPVPVSVQYAPDRHFVGRVRVFVEWAAELFKECCGMHAEPKTERDYSSAHPFNELIASL
ncbi:LysR family transcriptional regulator [Paraburkholderia sp. DHOC27]|uniref:LysR family transcriptional regulator n=1 Tax=Paraburkholderia sp. DHOC27 TaxID=2303330 RepID=UPI000E3DE0C4|nr:LysR family transcriptional regulator [Paraburkholderia sp. DHOC27]RFU49176.1 LysR family transcriptional regulator [Paraburkholderia sp. DHOC27]